MFSKRVNGKSQPNDIYLEKIMKFRKYIHIILLIGVFCPSVSLGRAKHWELQNLISEADIVASVTVERILDQDGTLVCELLVDKFFKQSAVKDKRLSISMPQPSPGRRPKRVTFVEMQKYLVFLKHGYSTKTLQLLTLTSGAINLQDEVPVTRYILDGYPPKRAQFENTQLLLERVRQLAVETNPNSQAEIVDGLRLRIFRGKSSCSPNEPVEITAILENTTQENIMISSRISQYLNVRLRSEKVFRDWKPQETDKKKVAQRPVGSDLVLLPPGGVYGSNYCLAQSCDKISGPHLKESKVSLSVYAVYDNRQMKQSMAKDIWAGVLYSNQIVFECKLNIALHGILPKLSVLEEKDDFGDITPGQTSPFNTHKPFSSHSALFALSLSRQMAPRLHGCFCGRYRLQPFRRTYSYTLECARLTPASSSLSQKRNLIYLQGLSFPVGHRYPS